LTQFQRNFTEKNVKNLIGDELYEVSQMKNAEKIPALFVTRKLIKNQTSEYRPTALCYLSLGAILSRTTLSLSPTGCLLLCMTGYAQGARIRRDEIDQTRPDQ